MKPDTEWLEGSIQWSFQLPKDDLAANWQGHPYTEKFHVQLKGGERQALAHLLNVASQSTDPEVRAAFAAWSTFAEITSAIKGKPEDGDSDEREA